MQSRIPRRHKLALLCVFGIARAVAAAEPTEAPTDPRRAAHEAVRERRDLNEGERALIARPDRKRPERRISIPLFGRPLTIGGRYSVQGVIEEDVLLDFDFNDLDNDDVDGDGNELELEDEALGKSPLDDRYRINQNLILDLFYPVTDRVSVYLSGEARWDQLIHADDENESGHIEVLRDETWLYASGLFGSPVSLQLGRQNFSDRREWWWDEDLDSVRLHLDGRRVHAEIAVAQELLKVSTAEDQIDPEQEEVLRVLGALTFEWAERQELSLRFLHQSDHSSHHDVGGCVRDFDGDGKLDDPPPPIASSPFFSAGCIDPDTEDESDADLTWIGLGASGRLKLGPLGRLHYWADAAAVSGRETFSDYAGESFQRRLDSVDRYAVTGVGVDVALTWTSPLPFEPTLTAGYAYGSGNGSTKERDRGFRQTGLQDDNAKFRGVDSFKTYGELLDPELANLHIVTGALGFPLLSQSSVELIYHYYRQDEAADFLRDVSFKRDPDGRHREIGQEWDLVIGIEEWDPFEIELIGAAFEAGKAFAPDDGQWSYLGIVQLRINF